MTDFVKNGVSELPPVKQDARVPTGDNSDWTAEDANQVRQALLDLRTQDIAEQAARIATDNAIIASGAEPANVGLAPVTPTGSAQTKSVADWLSRLDPDGGPIPVLSTGGTTKTLAEWTGDIGDLDAALAALTTSVGTKNRTFVQGTAPTSPLPDGTSLVAGDLWFDSNNAYTQYRWSGTTWVNVTQTPIPGADGAPGARGSLQFYVDISPSSAWSSTTAEQAIAGAGVTKQNGDTVTEYCDSAQFSETRFWDGAAWTVVSLRVNGNLLVDGTVGASKVAAGAISTNKLTVTNWDNLWPNGTSEDQPPPGYSYPNPSLDPEFGFIYNGLANSGSHCRLIPADGASRYNEVRMTLKASPGDQFHMQAMASSNGNAGCTNYMFIRFYDANMAWIGGQTTYLLPTGYALMSVDSGAAPAGTTYAIFALGNDSGVGLDSTFQVIYDNIYARRKISGAILTADAIQTSDYDGVNIDTANETCTTGTRVRANQSAPGPGIITSPEGLRVGSMLLSESWFSNSTSRAIRLVITNGSVAVYSESGTLLSSAVYTDSIGDHYVQVLFPAGYFATLNAGTSIIYSTATQLKIPDGQTRHWQYVPLTANVTNAGCRIYISNMATGTFVDPEASLYFTADILLKERVIGQTIYIL